MSNDLYVNLSKPNQSKENQASSVDVKIEPLNLPLKNDDMMCETDFVLENYSIGAAEVKKEVADYESCDETFKTSVLDSEIKIEIDEIDLKEKWLSENDKELGNEFLKSSSKDLENISVQLSEEVIVKGEENIELVEEEHLLEDVEEKLHESLKYGESITQNQLSFEDKAIHANKKIFICECGKMVNCELNSHKRIHSGVKPFKCDICKKLFRQRVHLNKHKFVHAHKCDFCGKSFNYKSNLNTHKLMHTGKAPSKCDICKKLFSHQGNLKRHMLSHTDETSNKCDICKRIFIRQGNLERHMLTHTVETSHKCEICKISFNCQRSLKRHTLIHTGVNYKCDICKKPFHRKSHLNRHTLIHTRQKHK